MKQSRGQTMKKEKVESGIMERDKGKGRAVERRREGNKS